MIFHQKSSSIITFKSSVHHKQRLSLLTSLFTVARLNHANDSLDSREWNWPKDSKEWLTWAQSTHAEEEWLKCFLFTCLCKILSLVVGEVWLVLITGGDWSVTTVSTAHAHQCPQSPGHPGLHHIESHDTGPHWSDTTTTQYNVTLGVFNKIRSTIRNFIFSSLELLSLVYNNICLIVLHFGPAPHFTPTQLWAVIYRNKQWCYHSY